MCVSQKVRDPPPTHPTPNHRRPEGDAHFRRSAVFRFCAFADEYAGSVTYFAYSEYPGDAYRSSFLNTTNPAYARRNTLRPHRLSHMSKYPPRFAHRRNPHLHYALSKLLGIFPGLYRPIDSGGTSRGKCVTPDSAPEPQKPACRFNFTRTPILAMGGEMVRSSECG